MKISLLIYLFGMLFMFSCKETTSNMPNVDKEILDLGRADAKSKVIADNVMIAMGGLEKWNATRYLSWTFFGSRKLVWDKKGSRVRIESPRDTSLYLTNLNTLEGRFFKNGIEITDSSVVNKKMKQAKSIWINDSYWLVMPFKLRDKGVNLKYLREDTITGGMDASVLELTFDSVGNTPENKYEIYIDQRDNLIKKWSFFKTADQTDPPRSWPWDNYQDINGLIISTDRSDKSGPSELRIDDVMADSVFIEF